MTFYQKMNRKLLVVIVFIEIVCIAFLGIYYYKKISFIDKYPSDWFDRNKLEFVENKNLLFFYEPAKNTETKVSLDFLGESYKYYATYFYNGDTLRQMENIFPKKQNRTYRIITLGDSFTFGSYLDTKDTYPSQLESILNEQLTCRNINRFEVLNLGVMAYDLQYAVERFRLRGQKYEPDLVLWLIIDDDFLRINEVLFPKAIGFSRDKVTYMGSKKDKKKIIYFNSYKKAKESMISELEEKGIIDLQRKYLSELNNYYNKKLAFLAFPFMKKDYKQILQEFAKSREEIFFYDQLPNIYSFNAFFPDGHPNKLGAKMIAENIKNYLINDKLIQCDRT